MCRDFPLNWFKDFRLSAQFAMPFYVLATEPLACVFVNN